MEFSFKRFSPSCQLPDVGLLILRHGPRSGGKFLVKVSLSQQKGLNR